MREPLLQSMAIIMASLALSIALYFIILQPDTVSPQATGLIINGGGSTLAAPQFFEWCRDFTTRTGIVVDYSSIGSGAGRAMFLNGTYFFAVSDPPLDSGLYSNYRGRMLQIPVIVGAVVIAYNLPEIPRGVRLNLTGEIIALIYKGEISKWNDERIRAVNPLIAEKLPDKEIIAVHRSDSSGTTRVFTGYLYKAAPGIWSSELVGFSIEWPVDKTGRGLGGKGNEGVGNLVRMTPYSIGYVEASYAISVGMDFANLMNRDGYIVALSEESVEAALSEAVKYLPDTPLGDFSQMLDAVLYVPGRYSYPLITFSYMLVQANYSDPYTAKALAGFIEYIVRDGQERLLPGYYRLPQKAVELGLQAAGILRSGGAHG